MDLGSLRKQYPQFFYEKFAYKLEGKNLKISFNFAVPPDIKFCPKVIIKNVSKENLQKIEDRVLRNLIFNLGLIEIPSYWKATCSPEIMIKAGALTKEQILWWRNLILKGMGEFFFQNKIDFTPQNFLRITCLKSDVKQACLTSDFKQGVLVPVGGGKDAIVTLELLKNIKPDFSHPKSGFNQGITPLVLNPKKEHREILRIAKTGKPIIVERTIDPKLLELNRKGYLNGHTPFSAYLAFLSVLVSAIFRCKYIALSNERSSNEGNVKYLGQVINHQYSKSFEFERKFHHYCKKYLAKNIEYFSFLRPLYELQIAKIFSKFPKYFPVFLSCNEARKTKSGNKKPIGKWCQKCAKCLFVFTSLYPFTKNGQLKIIFKKNLFEDKTLIPLMERLVGERDFKPFECVGTKKESLSAFYLGLKKQREKLPFLLQYFKDFILPKYKKITRIAKNILKGWNEQNLVPKNLAKILKVNIDKEKFLP